MNLRKRLRLGEDILGVMVQDMVKPILVPVLADIGYDFIVIDHEHGSTSFDDVQNMVIAAKSYNLEILVRISKCNFEIIPRYLDLGVDGIMMPHVDNRDEAKNIIINAKYPPIGKRGYGMRQILSKFHPKKNKEEYIKSANDHVIILIQVESKQSVENINEILELEQIDGVIMGPADFTMDLGRIGQYQDKDFEENIKETISACKSHKKSFGIHFGDIDLIKKWRKEGMNILMHSSIMGLIKDRGNQVISQLHLKEERMKNMENNGDIY